ncbi:helix-turn-helix transcriptional regulator [Larkinella sp. C7]|uniref:helix-turn-helix transcriptional regulator n=1 Tax=Larkinella sp. C7 TaxID=2576607 RepID=UPI0011115DE6|nr:helix-turn-helix transcriptional regulator [Larkinella sp. C7]
MATQKYRTPEGFPSRFKAFMKHLDLTPTTLAEVVDKKQDLRVKYNRYLTGEYEPKMEILQRISEAFPINLHWLLTGNGPMFLSMPIDTQWISTESKEQSHDQLEAIAN